MSKSSEKILQVAEQLFNEHGYTAVGVDLIRDQSHTSKTTMYTYFKSKNYLITEVLKVRDRRFRSSLTTAVQNGEQSTAGKIRSLFLWHFDWFKSGNFHGCMFVKVALDMPQDNKSGLIIAIQHKLWLKNFIYELLLGSKEIECLADTIFNILEGLIHRFLVFGYDETVAENSLASVLKIYNLFNPE
ncbi:MAG: TetR/AcrR family transcriptional regulator [Acinetobacter sp.]